MVRKLESVTGGGMMEQDNIKRTDQQAVVNKQLVDQLLCKETLLAEDGEQKYYLLSHETMEKLQFLPDANLVEISLTSDASRSQTAADPSQDDGLQQLSARLQNISKPEDATVTSSESCESACEYCAFGEEAYLFNDQYELEKFLCQYPGAPETEYNRNQQWAKRGMITEEQKQAEQLANIIERLKNIEAQLARLENYLIFNGAAIP